MECGRPAQAAPASRRWRQRHVKALGQTVPQQLDACEQHACVQKPVKKHLTDGARQPHANPNAHGREWQKHQRGRHIAHVQQPQPGIGNPFCDVDEEEETVDSDGEDEQNNAGTSGGK